MIASASDYLTLVSPYVIGGTDADGKAIQGEVFPYSLLKKPSEDFEAGITELENFLYKRHQLAVDAVAKKRAK